MGLPIRFGLSGTFPTLLLRCAPAWRFHPHGQRHGVAERPNPSISIQIASDHGHNASRALKLCCDSSDAERPTASICVQILFKLRRESPKGCRARRDFFGRITNVRSHQVLFRCDLRAQECGAPAAPPLVGPTVHCACPSKDSFEEPRHILVGSCLEKPKARQSVPTGAASGSVRLDSIVSRHHESTTSAAGSCTIYSEVWKGKACFNGEHELSYPC
eukprot:6196351-Pleurochrysis_carterae.AAC.1